MVDKNNKQSWGKLSPNDLKVWGYNQVAL